MDSLEPQFSAVSGLLDAHAEAAETPLIEEAKL